MLCLMNGISMNEQIQWIITIVIITMLWMDLCNEY